MVKGIGPKMAERIIKKFGDDAFDVIENHPDKLATVQGIGEKRVEMIQKTWQEQKEIRNVMTFLQSHGITPTYALKIYKKYKDRSIEIVEQNPYQLASDIWGIGFKSADKIAQNLGIALDAPGAFGSRSGVRTQRSNGQWGTLLFAAGGIASKSL